MTLSPALRRLRVLRLLPAMVTMALATAAQAEMRAGPWLNTAGSSVRMMLPDHAEADGWTHGGIEIRLEHGAKTYWRTPGETGVPTTADFAGSVGLDGALLQFPAPKAFDDGAGGIAYGYTESLILPVRFHVSGPAAKARLAARLEFGVCSKNMCMPAGAEPALSMGEGQAEPGLDQRFAAMLTRVAKPEPYKSAGPLAISALTATRTGTGLTLTITTRVPAGTATPDLFVEGKDTYATRRTSANGAAEASFVATASDVAGQPGEITITLVAGQVAIESKVDLDALAKQP